METKNILLLASQSQSRKGLIEEMQIPFKVLAQSADEETCDQSLPVDQLVQCIAREKMKHVLLPKGKEGDICFVLTADTLSQDGQGSILGKPADKEAAIAMLKALRQDDKAYAKTTSAFCLDKKVYKNGAWQTLEHIEVCDSAEHVFIVEDKWIETYLKKSCGYKSSGTIAIEEFGMQFLKSINGSYSTIRGLPLFELRQALEKIGFFR